MKLQSKKSLIFFFASLFGEAFFPIQKTSVKVKADVIMWAFLDSAALMIGKQRLRLSYSSLR